MNAAALHHEIVLAQAERDPCALATVVSVRGSVPRQPGAKMLVYGNRRVSGTVGGGRFESRVIEDALETIQEGKPQLKHYLLREGVPQPPGTESPGDCTVFIEPLVTGEAVWIVGGGHCSLAIARLATDCGFYVGVVEARAEVLAGDKFPAAERLVTNQGAPAFIAGRDWTAREALVIVHRDADLDKRALGAALRRAVPGYVGMMGSQRKVARVFDELVAEGHEREALQRVHAPIGLDIGAESPAEVAVSVVAEILRFMRGRRDRDTLCSHRNDGSHV